MSDPIKHECGVAFLRLLKPLSHFREKYDEPLWGLSRMQLLMAKQINRGQDGAGLGVIKLDPPFGQRYIARHRSNSKNSVTDLFSKIHETYNKLPVSVRDDLKLLKQDFPYAGEVFVGHLRYGTHGGNSIENLHPFLRQNNWMSRNLVLAGNYNLTNVDKLIQTLIELGQQPKEISDNVTLLEKIGHFLDEENEALFRKYKTQGLNGLEITTKIKEELNLERILKRSFKDLDGGYNIVGLIGHGDSFVLRDPNGIRPSFYYICDEFVAAASERSALATVFNLKMDDIIELKPGCALIVNKNGKVNISQILKPGKIMSCSFERIYFSKGNDRDIYRERRMLGKLLAPKILETLNYDVANTAFSYVPNTASTSFYGLIDGVNKWLDDWKIRKILENKDQITPDFLNNLFNNQARREKVLLKDAKVRTFITNDKERGNLVGSAYDITYGSIKPGIDNIVIIDDSIVRGTTLKRSILRILERLEPKKIIIVSSAPQIRYPDCYGIDMSRMKDFIAFRALLELIKEHKMEYKLEEVYKACLLENEKPLNEMHNKVKPLYSLFSNEAITQKIAEITKPKDFKPQLEIIFQSISNLHKACPNHLGDWYFTGDYPTPGGNKVANRSFCLFFEGNTNRAY